MDVAHLSQHFQASPAQWTHKEVGQWLELLNMREYKETFEMNKVDGLIIFDLEDTEIEEILHIKNSIHRKRLRNGIHILKAFKSIMEKGKKKLSAEKNNENFISESSDQSPVLSTSVFGSHNPKVLSLKGNQFYQSNLQTAQKRDLENIFNTNALANFDFEAIQPVTRSLPLDQVIEEEKLHDTPVQDKKSPSHFPEPQGHPNQFEIDQSNPMGIEEEESRFKRHHSEFNPPSHLPDLHRSHSAIDAASRNSPIGMKREHPGSASKSQSRPMAEMPQQIGNSELIIQPIDGVQSNNFYCINESGGRIGRHSNNEIVILEESVSRHHSVIEYKDNKFFLVDIGSTTGSFIKVVLPLILEEKMIIEMGSNQFYVEKIEPQDEQNGELHLKVIEGMHLNKDFIIANNATLGRKGQLGPNTIALVDDFHLSNTHAKFNYADGKFILEDLGSTNGSWLRVSPEGERSRQYELLDNMIFKIGASSTFKVKRSNSNYLEMMQPKTMDSSVNCAICYENDRDAVFMPCKHNVTCLKCSKNVKQCPVCRFKITDILKIYKSQHFV